MRIPIKILAVGVLASLQGCYGDCISLGYPSLDLTVVELGAEQPVGLGGAVLVFTTTGPSGRRDSVDTSFLGSTNTYTVYAVTGAVQIHIAKQGFAPWDSTVVVTTSGHCEVPDLKRVTARLRRP